MLKECATVNVLKFQTFFQGVIHKMLVRIALREDSDQTATSEAVWSGSELFALAVFQAFIVLILD